jgi:hypothetical protein
MAAKKQSQPEDRRRNKMLGLRLEPEAVAEVHERSAKYGVGVSRLLALAWRIAVESGELDDALRRGDW